MDDFSAYYMGNHTVTLDLKRETSVREIKRKIREGTPGRRLDDVVEGIDFAIVPSSFIRHNLEEHSVLEENLKKKIMSGEGNLSETPYLKEKEYLKNRFPYGPIAEAIIPELARLGLYASLIYYAAAHIIR